jgi:hypothetical protein
MLLPSVLFVLFLAACWLYCLADAALTPAAAFRGLPKAAWIGIIAVTFIAGAIAWLASRGPRYPRSWAATDMLTRPHEGGMPLYPHWMPPKGPDDDPEFLRELDRRIHGTSADSSEAAD